MYKEMGSLLKEEAQFHRWGGENSTGIDISVILQYLEWVDIFSQTNPLNPDNKIRTWRNFPNVPYVFGGAMEEGYAEVWASEAAIGRMGGWVISKAMRPERVVPMHSLLCSALDMLLHEDSPPFRTRQLRRLREAVEGGVPFLLNYEDYRRCSHRNWHWGGLEHSLPIFSLCGAVERAYCDHQFPLPTYFTVEWAKNSSTDWDTLFQRNDATYTWRNKINKAVWRGSPTGLGGKNRARNRFVRVANNFYNHTVDAQFTTQHTAMPFFDFQNYKAVLDIDGVSWSGRWGRILCLNSVVIKIQPKYIDYFAHTLIPGVHYLSVFENLTNLEQVVHYALAEENEKHIRDIISNARNWCRIQMLWSQIRYDTLRIFAEYVALLDAFDPTWQRKWNMTYLKPHFDMRNACR